MAMAGVGGAPGAYKSDINITPLVDVVLVLLIIFMVITPLLQMGYDVKVPPKATVDTPPPSLDQLIGILENDAARKKLVESLKAAVYKAPPAQADAAATGDGGIERRRSLARTCRSMKFRSAGASKTRSGTGSRKERRSPPM